MKDRFLANPLYTTAQVAEMAGIHKDTLLRWMRRGIVPEPTRNRNGWRVFDSKQVNSVVAYARCEEQPPLRIREPSSLIYTTASLAKLRRIDWDFKSAKTSYLTHGLHPYPAKFIPQIPNALIQELSSVGETVGDIFCGSGTTLVEALLLKRHAIGLDANPLACLISAAKTQRLGESDVSGLQELHRRAMDFASSLAMGERGSLFETAPFRSNAARPTDKSIAFWFESFIIEELAEIRSWCYQLASRVARTIALAAFSSIIVTVSKQDSDTRYVRREKSLSPGDAIKRFAWSLEQAIRAAVEFTDLVEPQYSCRIVRADIMSQPDVGVIDLVVCSPPYPNAYSYHLYHMTRMLWLEMDQPRFKKEEIGSHRKYGRSGPNGANEETFRSEMAAILQWLRKHLRQSGHACFVVGSSTIKGRLVDNADLISRAAEEVGFTAVERIQRNLQDTRKSFNPAIGKIKTESILILQN